MSDSKKSTVRNRFGLPGAAPPGPLAGVGALSEALADALVAVLISDDMSGSTAVMHPLFGERNDRVLGAVLAEMPDVADKVYVCNSVMCAEPVRAPFVPLGRFKTPTGCRPGGSPVFAHVAADLAALGPFLDRAYAQESQVREAHLFIYGDAEDTTGSEGLAHAPAIRAFYAKYPQVKTTAIVPDPAYDKAGMEIVLAPGSPPPVVVGSGEDAFETFVRTLTDLFKSVSRKVSTKRPARSPAADGEAR